MADLPRVVERDARPPMLDRLRRKLKYSRFSRPILLFIRLLQRQPHGSRPVARCHRLPWYGLFALDSLVFDSLFPFYHLGFLWFINYDGDCVRTTIALILNFAI